MTVSTSRRTVEVESLHELDRRIAAGVTSMAGWRLQGLDLRGRGDQLRRLDPRGALVLGGHLDPDDEAELRRRGALVFPTIPDAPVDPYRPSLYTPEELYDALVAGRSYEESPTRASTRGPPTPRRTWARWFRSRSTTSRSTTRSPSSPKVAGSSASWAATTWLVAPTSTPTRPGSVGR